MPRVIRAEIDIDAPVERVWEILHDIASYPQWNPFTPRVESTLREGDAVMLYVQMGPGRVITQKERVTRVAPPRRLCWGMKWPVPGLLRAERCQWLEPRPRGGATYRTADEFHGLLVPLVLALYGARIQAGFEATAQALKERAEG